MKNLKFKGKISQMEIIHTFVLAGKEAFIYDIKTSIFNNRKGNVTPYKDKRSFENTIQTQIDLHNKESVKFKPPEYYKRINTRKQRYAYYELTFSAISFYRKKTESIN